jgi:hypothetical protein
MTLELTVLLVSGSLSTSIGSIALMVTRLSRQRTERIKQGRVVDLERERLRLTMAVFERGAATGRPGELVDLTLALRSGVRSVRDSPEGPALAGSGESAPTSGVEAPTG